MKLLALPNGLIINLEAVATIQAAPFYKDENTYQPGLVITYFSLNPAKSVNGYGLINTFKGDDAEAILLELEKQGLSTGHLRTRMRAVVEAEERNIAGDE